MNSRPSLKIIFAILLVVFASAAFGVFVWPTQYRYDTVTYRREAFTYDQIWRINRFTGVSELLVDSRPQPTKKTLPASTPNAPKEHDIFEGFFDPLKKNNPSVPPPNQSRERSIDQYSDIELAKIAGVELPTSLKSSTNAQSLARTIAEKLTRDISSKDAQAIIGQKYDKLKMNFFDQPITDFVHQPPRNQLTVCYTERYFPYNTDGDPKTQFRLNLLFFDFRLVEWYIIEPGGIVVRYGQ